MLLESVLQELLEGGLYELSREETSLLESEAPYAAAFLQADQEAAWPSTV